MNNLVNKVGSLLDILISKIDGSYKEINTDYAPWYFERVEFGIRYMKDSMSKPKFIRDKDRLFRYFIEEFKGEYCPSSFYRIFSFHNKFHFACLRSEIDEILENENDPNAVYFKEQFGE